jgi:hypothetical protein
MCHHTRERRHAEVPAIANHDHPLDDAVVTEPLGPQNVPVIRAGDGVQPFGGSDDDPATRWIDGRTWHHQPVERRNHPRSASGKALAPRQRPPSRQRCDAAANTGSAAVA